MKWTPHAKPKIGRRRFLSSFGAAIVLTLSGRPFIPFRRTEEPFELVVVGDSLIWGQGLHEKDKMYTLAQEWLSRDVFNGRRPVNLTLRAHSGSTIKFHPNEAAAFAASGRAETDSYDAEVNVSFPSIWKQVELVEKEFGSGGRTADLVLLSGGVADITVPKLLDPLGDDEKLVPLIAKYCRDDMADLLFRTATAFPRSLIAVIGYFPIISPMTKRSRLFNSWLEAMGFPRQLKSAVNNPLLRPMLDGIRKKGIKRSRIWFAESNRYFQAAVDSTNKKVGRTQAVFVRSPITEETCFETPSSLLFRIGEKGRVNDPLYEHRVVKCGDPLQELKRSTGLNYSTRHCEIAAVGHPNIDGSRAYARSITEALQHLLRPS